MRFPLGSVALSSLACMVLVSCEGTQPTPKAVAKLQPPPAALPAWTQKIGKAGTRNGRQVQFATKYIEVSREQSADVPKGAYRKKLNEGELQAFLRSLSQTKGADLMTTPLITAREGESAQVRVGREFSYPKDAEAPEKMTREFIGLSHYVRARPTANGKRLKLDVLAQVTELKGFSEEADGFKQPVFARRRASSSVELATGQTIVMGGLVTEDEQEVEDRVPILGDIPLVGRAFRNRGTNKIWRELIVVVTPTVMEK